MPAIASIDALLSAIPARGRGAACARRALRDVRVGAESPMETLLRLLLLRAGLPEPQLNPAVDVGDGILHPDLLYPEWRVVLEYEGDGHRTDQRQWRRDIARREAFESAGWRVIRVHRDDVLAEPEAFLARVCRILAQRQRDVRPMSALARRHRAEAPVRLEQRPSERGAKLNSGGLTWTSTSACCG